MKKTFLWIPLITFISLFGLASGIVYATTSNVEVTGQIGVRTVSSTEPEEPSSSEEPSPEETTGSEGSSASGETPAAGTSSDERELANISKDLPQTNAMADPWIAAFGGILLLIVFALFIRKRIKAGKTAE